MSWFDGVAKFYDRIKPIRGDYRDIRPVSNRKRKWERVAKLPVGNGYVFFDGTHDTSLSQRNGDIERSIFMAPILYERREDGDYVRIRSVAEGSYSCQSRATFLHRWLPDGMRLGYGSRGLLLLNVRGADGEYKDYILPRTILPTITEPNPPDMCLWFKQVEQDKWERVGSIEVQTHLIDKAMKKSLKPVINEFFETMNVYGPMMVDQVHPWKSREDISHTITNWIKDNRPALWVDKRAWFRIQGTHALDSKLSYEVITDKEHPLHYSVAAMLWLEVTSGETNEPDEERKKLRKTIFNNSINRMLNLYTTVTT